MSLQKLERYVVDEALPKWAATAFDEQHGHFMESLQLDGTPETTGIVRTRTVGRLIYVYAHASVLKVGPPGSLEKAERAFHNLHRVAWTAGDKPGYARTINRFTDEVLDPERDLYDNACMLLALAWLYKATNDPKYRLHIEATIAAVDQTLNDPFGGWAEDSIGSLPRRQNPHMHYLEASLALCETSDNARSGQMVDKLFALFLTHFNAGTLGPLRENFGPHWEVSDRFRSNRLEPGHMCEWVWLARRYDLLTGRNVQELCETLLTTGLTVGRFEQSVLLLDEATFDGAPLAPHRRLWPQVEMLKAFLMQYYALGDITHRSEAEAVAKVILETYLSAAPAGCWHDALDLEGNPIAKTIPASSLYHLWTAVVELLNATETRSAFAASDKQRIGRASGPFALPQTALSLQQTSLARNLSAP